MGLTYIVYCIALQIVTLKYISKLSWYCWFPLNCSRPLYHLQHCNDHTRTIRSTCTTLTCTCSASGPSDGPHVLNCWSGFNKVTYFYAHWPGNNLYALHVCLISMWVKAEFKYWCTCWITRWRNVEIEYCSMYCKYMYWNIFYHCNTHFITLHETNICRYCNESYMAFDILQAIHIYGLFEVNVRLFPQHNTWN